MLGVMATTTLPDIGRAARWFHALSDATRLEIVRLLSHGERCVCELQDVLDAAQSRLSFHLKTLKDAGLVTDRRVGPTGKAYGLDMTDEMLDLARENQRKAGVANVEFLKGEIERIPLPDASVDVVISNCVINLSADKRRVLAEAFRVLKPGGRFAVSDVVVRGALPAAVRRDVELWVGCVAGALEEVEYRRLLAEVGFEGIGVESTRVYAFEAARAVAGEVMSAFVRAHKPLG